MEVGAKVHTDEREANAAALRIIRALENNGFTRPVVYVTPVAGGFVTAAVEAGAVTKWTSRGSRDLRAPVVLAFGG